MLRVKADQTGSNERHATRAAALYTLKLKWISDMEQHLLVKFRRCHEKTRLFLIRQDLFSLRNDENIVKIHFEIQSSQASQEMR